MAVPALGQLAGVGAVAKDLDGYHLFTHDQVQLPAGLQQHPRLVWDLLEVAADQVDSLAKALVEGAWLRFLEQAGGKEWQA